MKKLIEKNKKLNKNLLDTQEKAPGRNTGRYPLSFMSQNTLEYVKEVAKQIPEFFSQDRINRIDGKGQTPLFVFIAIDNHEIASFLIEKGADVNQLQQAKGWQDVTLLHIALNKYNYNIQFWRKQLDTEEELMESNPVQDSLKTIELLLKNNADIHKKAKLFTVENYLNGDKPYPEISSYELAEKLKLHNIIDLMKKYNPNLTKQIEQQEAKKVLEKLTYSLYDLQKK